MVHALIENLHSPVCRNERNQVIGEHHVSAKLTDGQVHEIRDRHELRSETCRMIAENMGLNFWTVVEIVKYRRRPFVPLHLDNRG